MKKKLVLILANIALCIGTFCTVLMFGKDGDYSVKANVEPFSLNLTNLSGENTSLTTFNGNVIEFEVSGYSNGTFSNGSYIRNVTPISGLESLIISFKTLNYDLTISYGWFPNEYYSTDGVINSENSTFSFGDLGPSYFKLENQNGEPIETVTIQLTYSCSETYEPGIKYSMSSDGKSYYVSGYDGFIENAHISPEYNAKPVTSIADSAFSGCWTMTSVVIPSTITSLGDSAFWGCSSLTSVVIPNSITLIGSYAFYGCSSLSSISFGSGVSSVGSSSFDNCTSLTSFEISENNNHYSSADGVLFNKEKTTLIRCPEGKSGAYDVPNTVSEISNNAFRNCIMLTSIFIPYGVNSIGGGAFESCSSLISVNISNSITSIESYAFYRCTSLTTIIIPDSVDALGSYVFAYCSSLTSICVDENNNFYSSIDGVLFNKEKTTLLECPNGKTGDYYVPNTTIMIADYAFAYCFSLTSVIIPDSVDSIGNCAFCECSSLSSISLGGGLISIATEAFLYCSSLVYIIIPNNVTLLGEYVFTGCDALTTIYCGAQSCPSGWASNWNYFGCPVIWGYNPEDYSKVKYTLSNDEQFYYVSGFETGIQNAIIRSEYNGKPVTSIGGYSFYHCSSLLSVLIPDSVNTISYYAFEGCTLLAQVNIPDSVVSVGISAFFNCSSLTSIAIPDSVISIGTGCFSGCSSLYSVSLGNNINTIEISLFYGCSSLTSIIISNNVISIRDYAFYGCTSLASIFIPSSVTTVGYYVFFDCLVLNIYCEASSKPSGWDIYWNPNNRPVVWGQSEE